MNYTALSDIRLHVDRCVMQEPSAQIPVGIQPADQVFVGYTPMWRKHNTSERLDGLPRLKASVSCFEQPLPELRKYRLWIFTGVGDVFENTNVVSVDRDVSFDKGRLCLRYQPMVVCTPVEVTSIAFVNQEDQIISQHGCSCRLLPGDTFNPSYSVQF